MSAARSSFTTSSSTAPWPGSTARPTTPPGPGRSPRSRLAFRLIYNHAIGFARSSRSPGNPGQALGSPRRSPGDTVRLPHPNLVHAGNASKRYGHAAAAALPGQWRHVEEVAKWPDAHACRSTGSARITSALAMTQRPCRTADQASAQSRIGRDGIGQTLPVTALVTFPPAIRLRYVGSAAAQWNPSRRTSRNDRHVRRLGLSAVSRQPARQAPHRGGQNAPRR